MSENKILIYVENEKYFAINNKSAYIATIHL